MHRGIGTAKKRDCIVMRCPRGDSLPRCNLIFCSPRDPLSSAIAWPVIIALS